MVAKHAVKVVAVALGFFALVSGLALAGVAYAYQGRFYPGVSVGGVALGGTTYAEGSALVSDKVISYTGRPVHVVVPDITKPREASTNRYPDVDIAGQAGELGLVVDGKAELASAWSIGHDDAAISWVKTAVPVLFNGSRTSLAYHIDQAQVDAFVHARVLPRVVTPTPAKLVVEGASVKVAQPQPGLQIDQLALSKSLASALQTAPDGDPAYVKAVATEADSPITVPAVQPIATLLDAIGNVQVTLAASGISLKPTRAQLLTWYASVQDDQGKLGLELQKDQVASYLKAEARLDQEKSLDAADTALATLAVATTPPPAKLAVAVTVKPVVKTAVAPGSYTLNKYEGKYIEVNLAEQKMYLITSGTLEKTYIVSSGKWSTPTPPGEYKIGNKSPRAYSASFGLYMPYWQAFLNNQYGIHELPEWPNGYKEGAAHLGTPVSHGCVRLGTGDAKEVYDWTVTGTPLYIH